MDRHGAPSYPSLSRFICIGDSTVVPGSRCATFVTGRAGAAGDATSSTARRGSLAPVPFDHDRRLMPVLAETPDGGAMAVLDQPFAAASWPSPTDKQPSAAAAARRGSRLSRALVGLLRSSVS